MSVSADYIDYKYRHFFIQWLINIDLPLFRRLAHNMPNWLIPKPTKSVHLRLPNELLIYIDPVKDKGVENTLYFTGTYEMGTLDVIDRFLPEEGTFIDVGANIGLMSLYAALKTGDDGRVIAFEPNIETYKIAEHNISINSFEDKIQLIKKGLGSKSETKKLYDNWSINRGAASLVKNSDEAQGSEIEITKLDKIIDGRLVDLVKIDVEGYELEVLKGATSLLKRDHPPVLIVECTEETEHQDYSRSDLYNFIQDTQPRYKFYKLKGTKLRRSPLIKIDSVDDLPTHDNLICIPSAI
tara:strand:+ start:15982 stop:16872 length:891 start_codon:yes stop_codon:yes gene_type:complete